MPGSVRRKDFRFFHALRVRWAEVDPQNVVFNANYYVYFDVAITEYWRAIGLRYPADLIEKGSDLYAVRSGAQFHAPAHYDDVIDIGCRAARIGRSSLAFSLGIWRGAQCLTSGELVYVNANPATSKPAALPGFVVDKILKFESVAPDTGH